MVTILNQGMRRFRSNPTVVLLSVQVLTAAVAFAINIMSAAVMHPAGRGDLALALQVTYLLTAVSMLGIDRPYIAGRSVKFPRALAELTLLLRPGLWSVAVTVACAIGLVIVDNVPLALAAGLIAAYIFGNMQVQVVRVGYIVSGAQKHFVLTAVMSQVVLLMIGLIFLFAGVDVPNLWFLAYVVVGFISVAVVAFNRDRTTLGPVSKDKALKGIRMRGLKMLPASLGNTAMLRSDRLLLPLLASSSELGIYVVVATVMELATWPVQQWVDSSLRKWNRSAPGPALAGLALMGKAAGLVSALSIAFGAVAYLAVVNLLPKAYMGSLVLLAPLGFAAVFYAMTRVQQGLLIAQGHAGRVSLVEIVGMSASVAMYLILIPGLGAMGAALGSAIGYFVCLVFGAIIYFRSRPAKA